MKLQSNLHMTSQQLVPCPLKAQELEDASTFGLFPGLETGSKLEDLPLNNICQVTWDAQKGGVTGIQLQNLPCSSTSTHELVLSERRESLILSRVQIDATSVISSVLIVYLSDRRVE